MSSCPENTLFIPTKDSILMDMLTGSLGVRVNGVNLYDMAQFVEDFVLTDHVWVYPSLHNMLSPELKRVQATKSCDVLFNTLDAMPHMKRVDFSGPELMLEKIFETAERIQKITSDACFQLPPDKKTALLLHMLGYMNSYASLQKAYSDYLRVETTMYKLLSSYSRSPYDHGDDVSLEKLRSGVPDSEKVLEAIQHAYSLCRREGLSVSPGIGYTSYFMRAKRLQPSVTKLLYEAVSSSHRELIRRLEDTAGLRLVYVPPLLSILFGRAKNRDNLLSELMRLRSEFTDLREQARYFKEAFLSAVTLREKLDALNEFDIARDALVKRITRKPSRSVVKEVWEIVKGRSIWGAFTKFADMALQWDQEHKIIRRVSRFQLVSDLALSIPRYESLLEKIYGPKAINLKDIRIDPWENLAKAQASGLQGSS